MTQVEAALDGWIAARQIDTAEAVFAGERDIGGKGNRTFGFRFDFVGGIDGLSSHRGCEGEARQNKKRGGAAKGRAHDRLLYVSLRPTCNPPGPLFSSGVLIRIGKLVSSNGGRTQVSIRSFSQVQQLA